MMILVLVFGILELASSQVCLSNYDCPRNMKCEVQTSSGLRSCIDVSIGNGVQPVEDPVIQCYSSNDCAPHQICQLQSNGDRFCKEQPQVVFCNSNTDCPTGETCVRQHDGTTVCLITVGGTVGHSEPEYCRNDQDCPNGKTCVLQQDRSTICQITVGGNVGNQQNSPNYCRSDNDCPRGETCVPHQDGTTVCQITVGGNVGRGGINSSCSRDSDCKSTLRCVKYYGELMCRIVTGDTIQPSRACKTTEDCPFNQVCRYRPSSGTQVCVWRVPNTNVPLTTTSGPVVGGYVQPADLLVGNTVTSSVKNPKDEKIVTLHEFSASQDDKTETVGQHFYRLMVKV